MCTSLALTKQNVATVLTVNDGCCSGPFHSDQSCCLNKLYSFRTNILCVCFRSLFWLLCNIFFLRALYVQSLQFWRLFSFVIKLCIIRLPTCRICHQNQQSFYTIFLLHQQTVRPLGSDSPLFKLPAHSKLTDSIRSVTLQRHHSNLSVLWGAPSAKWCGPFAVL